VAEGEVVAEEVDIEEEESDGEVVATFPWLLIFFLYQNDRHLVF